MRTVLFFLLVFALSVLTAFAQTEPVKPTTTATQLAAPAGAATAASADVVTEKTSAVIPREKFDPAKDPVADLQKAVEKATAENKRIILDVGGEWCIWCRYMDRFFTLNPELDKLRTNNFVWVKVNLSEENENKAFLSAYPAASGYPHFYILDEKGKLLQSQATDILENGKTYSLEKFTAFFKLWTPNPKKPGAPPTASASSTVTIKGN